MKERLLFSIIVPVYNAREYLPRCIDSVLAQTLDAAAWEAILVDDGSSDGSSGICDDYGAKAPNLRVIHKENGGHTSARNAGLLAARGEYMIFVDSDDWVSPEMLSCCAEEIKANHPDMVLFGYWKETIDGPSAVPPDIPLGSYGMDRLEQQILPHVIMDREGRFFPRALWGKAFRRALIYDVQMRVPLDIRTGEDMCCVICTAFAAGRISVLEDCLYHYRILPGSLSRRGDGEACGRCRSLLQFLEQESKAWGDGAREQLLRLTVQQMYSAAVRLLRAELPWPEKKKRFRSLYQLELCRQAVLRARFSAKAGTLRMKRLLLRHRCLEGILLLNKSGSHR